MKITRSLVCAPDLGLLHGKGSTVPFSVQDEKERQSALQKLLEMQRQDFADAWLENVGNPEDFHGAFKRPPKTGECFCLFHLVPHQVGRWADV